MPQNKKTFTEKGHAVKLSKESTNLETTYLVIAIIEAIIIMLLIVNSKLKKKELPDELKPKGPIDIESTFEDIIKIKEAQELKKILVKRCHPDRFHNDPIKKEIAERLTRQLNENRSIHSELKLIEQQINQELYHE
jgi:hypothetical protein